jgi:hypothetical protein
MIDTHRKSTLRAELLQALDSLGGYATSDQLIKKTGYCQDWSSINLTALVDLGILQRSKMLPHLYSKVGSGLAPRPVMRADLEGIRGLARLIIHVTGTNDSVIRRMASTTHPAPRLDTLQVLATKAGYKILFVPIS